MLTNDLFIVGGLVRYRSDNRRRLGEADGVDLLLRAVAPYKGRAWVVCVWKLAPYSRTTVWSFTPVTR